MCIDARTMTRPNFITWEVRTDIPVPYTLWKWVRYYLTQHDNLMTLPRCVPSEASRAPNQSCDWHPQPFRATHGDYSTNPGSNRGHSSIYTRWHWDYKGTPQSRNRNRMLQWSSNWIGASRSASGWRETLSGIHEEDGAGERWGMERLTRWHRRQGGRRAASWIPDSLASNVWTIDNEPSWQILEDQQTQNMTGTWLDHCDISKIINR